ncbi:nuclease-related domain-containing protein [Niallia taxi]|uniref:nuclease-related domain-containing protein n=1 Tax=Niallia taxi TaxID=2499688 RepID=UPI002E215D1B|nr:nuclease-related domain-containing protein [Niallia taxi]MED4118880.1 nuclease-related domain-containing protein [Niallia taxi]
MTQEKGIKAKVAADRIGELGEYKINIQLDQLPKNYLYLSDLLIKNSKAKSGYSQIDHIVFTPYAIFVIETKNYKGTIYGDRKRKSWSVNGKFPMMNPFNQNYGHIEVIKAVLSAVKGITYVSMISFTKRAVFKVNEELRQMKSNDLIVYDTELSNFITRKCNVLKLVNPNPIFSDLIIKIMHSALEKANVTSPELRKLHVDELKRDGQSSN